MYVVRLTMHLIIKSSIQLPMSARRLTMRFTFDVRSTIDDVFLHPIHVARLTTRFTSDERGTTDNAIDFRCMRVTQLTMRLTFDALYTIGDAFYFR